MNDRHIPSRRDLLKAAAGAAALGVLPLAGPVAFAQGKKEKVGVIGSGNVGSNIGRVWAEKGYEVMFSSRNLDSDKELAAKVGKNARAGTPQEAAAFGDVLLFAVPYGALPELGKTLAGPIIAALSAGEALPATADASTRGLLAHVQAFNARSSSAQP